MASFMVGDEVIYRDNRYIIASRSGKGPYTFRLLASTPQGTQVAWANAHELRPVSSYLNSRDDTSDYG